MGELILDKFHFCLCLNLNRFHFSYLHIWMECMLHEMNMKKINPYLAFDHRFGFRRTTSAEQTSSFLLHTPYEALHSTILVPSQYVHHETPPSILQQKRRLSKQHLTTYMPTVTSTPLRGDQQPQIDDYESTYGSDEIVLLKNQPATVAPYYFTNERDKTERRIASISLSISMFLFFSFNVPTLQCRV